jgi:hypothetical protein
MTLTTTSTLPNDVNVEVPSLPSLIHDCLNKCKHYFLVGDKDQGKSSLSCAILQEHYNHTKRPCFMYQPPKPELLPNWVTPITDLDKLPIGAVCVIDEASTEFSQYSNHTLSNRKLADKMQIARHRDQSIILICQTSKRLNRNLLYPIDVYLLKRPTLFQVPEERALIRKAYERIEEPIQVNEYYWMDQDRFEKGTFTKPTWYTPELSKAYSSSSPSVAPIPQPQAATPNSRRFIQPQPQSSFRPQPFKTPTFKNTGVRSNRSPHPPSLVRTIRNHLPSGPSRSFDPAGLILVAIVGTFGLISLLRGAWGIAALCLPLALAGLFFSHSHFDRS